jgi:pyruvate carboxylase subunit B
MSTKDLLPAAEMLDQAGYYALEAWGGASFDAPLRFLREDPWERLRAIRRKVKNTKLMMLLRGQNLVGYRHYSDDVVERFVEKSHENGIDVFRIFDALNDLRNLMTALHTAKKVGAEIQLCVVYTVSPIHTVEYYEKLVEKLASYDPETITVKDMSGILKPYMAYELVRAIKKVGIRVNVHSHTTAGLAPFTFIKSVEAGADIFDVVASSISMYTSHIPAESAIKAVEGTPYSTKVDFEVVKNVSKYIWEVRKKYAEFDYARTHPPVDLNVLEHQIPGGMLSNLQAQLRENKAEHLMAKVLEEVRNVRRDLGWPPLVTPLSQIVGAQAVLNVLSNSRYRLVIREVKDYVRGMYGAHPTDISPEIKKIILHGVDEITVRPADLLEHTLPKIMKELPKEYVEKEEDYLTYALFPQVALEYFKWRKESVRHSQLPAHGT